MALDYWYDQQMRRYWLQFSRIFEGFQYQTGVGADGQRMFRTFPVKLAGKDSQVGHLLRNNSMNTMTSVPRVTCAMTDIKQDETRRQNPNHVSTVNVVERHVDPSTQEYTDERGRAYTVERYMAVPYVMTMQVDIWTSNEEQKHQFMEQVLVLFNPAIDLQTGTNPVDWTSLTIVELTDINWSSRSFPMAEEAIEIATLTFKMPVWLSPPAKVKRQNIIHQIITNIHQLTQEMKEDEASGDGVNFSDADFHTRLIVTPRDLKISVDGNVITLLNKFGAADPVISWRDTLKQYGRFRPGVSQLRLKTTDNMDDHDTDVIGTYDIHPTEENKLIWTVDLETLPINTLSAITGVLDAQGRIPGRGLPAATTGQRYLLKEDLHETPGWSNLAAHTNDIIEYNGTEWVLAFDASESPDQEYVLNSTSEKQLRWTGEMWVLSVEGIYSPGFWRVFL